MNLPGGGELIIILVVVLLLFGSTRLPKLARSMGEASKEFKRGANDGAGDAAPPADAKVTMTRAELDALLADERAKGDSDTPPPA